MTQHLIDQCRTLAARLWGVNVIRVSCEHYPEDGGWASVHSGLIVQRASSLEDLVADLGEAIKREQP